jgi:hypothetical protein
MFLKLETVGYCDLSYHAQEGFSLSIKDAPLSELSLNGLLSTAYFGLDVALHNKMEV